ncbi:MAG: hypothetical protein HZB42_04135 [Sphingobacteriales bacterium]|nr:hypothetical protein [Sphingobacteriales bacterium]
MENQVYTLAGTFSPGTTLRQLINNLVSDSLSDAAQNGSTIVNEVDKEILLGMPDPGVFPVLNELIGTVVANSRKGEIHITADVYADVMTIQIQERNNYNGYALSFSVNSIEPEASSVGGHIAINGPQKKVTTISFSFPNQHAA